MKRFHCCSYGFALRANITPQPGFFFLFEKNIHISNYWESLGDNLCHVLFMYNCFKTIR